MFTTDCLEETYGWYINACADIQEIPWPLWNQNIPPIQFYKFKLLNKCPLRNIYSAHSLQSYFFKMCFNIFLRILQRKLCAYLSGLPSVLHAHPFNPPFVWSAQQHVATCTDHVSHSLRLHNWPCFSFLPPNILLTPLLCSFLNREAKFSTHRFLNYLPHSPGTKSLFSDKNQSFCLVSSPKFNFYICKEIF